jgi:hypothetical protein
MTTTTVEPPGTGSNHPVCRFTDVVDDALDRVSDAAVWSMTADEQRATLTKLAAVQTRLAELALRVLTAGDANNIGRVNPSPTTGAWLANATRQTRAGAHGDVKLAAALETEFDLTRHALAAGRILVEQARVIVKAIQALPAEEVSFTDRRRAEAHLLRLAREHDAVELQRLGKHLFEVIAPEDADRRLGEQLAKQEAEARRKTFLELHDNPDGTTSVAGGMTATVVVTMTLEQLLTGLGAASLDTGG